MTSLVQVKSVKKILVSLVYVGKERITQVYGNSRFNLSGEGKESKWSEFSLTNTKIKECSLFPHIIKEYS